jgi:tetratricopeptide (TPR) repeat protein
MTQDEIQELEREANGHYQAGDYQRAREVWQQILDSDPENSRAAEGVRMASLLSENWNFFAQEGGEEEVSLQSGLDRILRMTQGGDFEGAFGLLGELEKEFPDSEPVAQARQEVQNAYEMAPFLNEQLRLAQEKLDAGEIDEARAACAKVLALDPTNRNARMMQEQIEYGASATVEAAPSASESAPVGEEPWAAPAAESEEAEPRTALDADEGAALTTDEPSPEGDLPELELLEIDEGAEPADLPGGEPEPAAPAPERETPPAPADEIDAGLDAALGGDEPEPAAPSLDLPLPEEGLETSATEDLADPDPSFSEPPAEVPAGEIADPQGLSDGDTERFLALVEEGHRALDESRYQDAIELLSHALAMDESHEGASRLLEKARREQAESHRVAEAKMLEATDLYESGRLEESASLFAQVLDAVPDHHSAREYLTRIERERDVTAAAAEASPEALDEPLDLPELGAAEVAPAAADTTGISPGEVALDEGGAEAVDLAAPAVAEPPAAPEEPSPAEAETAPLEDFPELEEETSTERAKRSRKPLFAVAALLLVGAGVAGWFYRDRIVALFDEGGEGEVLSHEQRASLDPPAAGGAKTEAQILEMIEEAANGSTSAGSGPEAVQPGGAGQSAPLTHADVGRLLEEARTDVRAGRGVEALATLKRVMDLDEGNTEAGGIQKAARLIVTAREGFAGGEYEESLRALYRLDLRVDPSLRPVAVGRWLDNTRWNFLLAQLQDEQPWRVLDLTHASRGELQLRGADREAVRPLIEVARRWQYESGRELKSSAYQSEVAALRLRTFDE